MAGDQIFFITKEEIGERLDKMLSFRFSEKSRTYFHYLIENGYVLVNGEIVKKRTLLEEGDEVEVIFHNLPTISLEPEKIPLQILYEDEYILAVNKPPGMVTHPAPGNWSHTFVNALLYHCRSSLLPTSSKRPGIVHRLDKETSGVLLAAKTTQVQQKLIEIFSRREIKKTYLGICQGNLTEKTLSAPIGRNPLHRKKMAIIEKGKEAITKILPLHCQDGYTLAKFFPQTGRTHQIRVHCQQEKAPIVGDQLYAPSTKKSFPLLSHHLLHALSIELEHPITKKFLEIKAPLPADFVQALQEIFSLAESNLI